LGTKELAVALRQCTILHILLHQGIFDKSNMTIVSHPPYFSAFPQLKVKLKGRHFDTAEVIKGESQVVLNAITEHDFQDAFKKWQKHREWCTCAEEDYLEGDGG
jgi:hypothetical protein